MQSFIAGSRGKKSKLNNSDYASVKIYNVWAYLHFNVRRKVGLQFIRVFVYSDYLNKLKLLLYVSRIGASYYANNVMSETVKVDMIEKFVRAP